MSGLRPGHYYNMMKYWDESVIKLVIGGEKNSTQYCLTWVFLPFVHVVKFLICLVCIVAVLS